MEENNQEDNVLRELFEIWAEKTFDPAFLDRTEEKGVYHVNSMMPELEGEKTARLRVNYL